MTKEQAPRTAEHGYQVGVRWTGNLGVGTAGYRAYARNHEVTAAGKPVLLGSSDAAFRGDASRWNPEELLVAALSQCHLLAYLHLCAEVGVVVTEYEDRATGVMVTDAEGGGRFTEVTLRPVVTVLAEGMSQAAQELHGPAHERCFIASSVNFQVGCDPSVLVNRLASPDGSSD